MIVGIATFTIVASTMIIATPSAMNGIAIQRRRSAIGEPPLAVAASTAEMIASGPSKDPVTRPRHDGYAS